MSGVASPLVFAATGASAAFAAVALFLYVLHMPTAAAVGLGRHGAAFWPTYAAHLVAYGGAAAIVGAVAGFIGAMVMRASRRREP